MSLGEFVKVYEEDMRPRLKRNTWLSTEHRIATKILPYFASKPVNEITPSDLVHWENELLNLRTSTGQIGRAHV